VAVAFNALNNLLRRGVHVRPAAVVGKLKLFAMVGDGFSLMRLLSAVRQGGRGENAADDDAGEQMPRLRLQANLDGHVIRADFIQQIVELIKRPDGERAGGLKEHLKGAGPCPRPAVGRSDAMVCSLSTPDCFYLK
jgi:hypothetical protein